MKIDTEQRLRAPSLDLTLDAAAERVWLGGHELSLTAREFAVLRYLVGQPGCLVTTSELLSAIWGSDQVIGDTALRTVIKRLRRKLGDDPRQPRYIITVWGRGYRFHESMAALSGDTE